MLSQLLEQVPNWEHGYGAFTLADCYEDCDNIEKAREAYLLALSFSPSEPQFIGAYASFLFLHGTAQEAFDQHLELLRYEYATGSLKEIAQTIQVLSQLGLQINLSQAQINRVRSSASGGG